MRLREIKRGFVLQQGQNDCGIACLSSIVNYYGGEYNQDLIRKNSGTTKQGTTLIGLLRASEKIGITAEGLQAEHIDNLRELSGPAILHVVLNGLNHYVVFYKFDQNQIIIGDPGKGVQMYSYDELSKIWVNKELLSLSPNEAFIKKENNKNKKKKWLFNVIKEDLGIIFVALALGIMITGIGLSNAIFTQTLVDDILPDRNTEKLIISLVAFTILLFARAGLTYLRGLFLIHQSKNFNTRVSRYFYSSLLRLDKSFFDTRRTGELISRMSDTRRIQTTISLLIGSMLIDLLLILVTSMVLFFYSWMIGLIIIFFIPIYGWLIHNQTQPIASAQKDVMVGFALTESHNVDTIHGIDAIKGAGKEFWFDSMNSRIVEQFQSGIFALGKMNIRFGFMAEAVNVIFMTLTFALGAWINLTHDLLIGEMVAIITMSSTLMPSMTRLVIINIQVQEAKLIFNRMFEFTNITPELELLNEDRIKKREVNTLDVQDISFRFPGQPLLLHNISFQIRKGEIVGLIGDSGSGKSTILQVLQKFYTPESGTLKLDNYASSDNSIIEWRKHIAAVPQEVKIFNGTLMYNICLSDNDTAAYLKIVELSNRHGFSHFFEKLPQGYFTPVGESGINLSGGQKQLVGLVRALYHNPSFLLLDEATSAMDHKMEKLVLDVLKNIKNEVGIFMITHRIKTNDVVDKWLLLENGKMSK